MNQPIPKFTLNSEHHVDSLNITVQEFTHTETGAQHIHLANDSEENVFLVALRTVPEDSTGVAHILEHTALCGSEKFPVRDPFFMMTRRSLNTFMNAFTSSDWTAYPFSSLNKKDFDNLMNVYLDAVFFARLDPLDFAQEGHRLEFKEQQNPSSPLEFKGVVFNEMKGAMSSVTSQLWQTVTKYLFPTSTYHFNSGGEPEDIPDLSYEELVAFYKTHYHPSNAIFMTFGNISAAEHQSTFQDHVLHKFDKLDEHIEVEDEKRYFAPISVKEHYACDEEDLNEKSHVVLAWLLGPSTDLDATLRAQLLTSVLIDNSACPLMLALETTDLGNAPSPLCGLDDSQKEMSFMCGLSGTETERAEDIEQLILGTLEQVAETGIAVEDLESALHQLELNQREIGGDSYPYGLQLILKSLTGATHRGNPAELLDLDESLSRLREEIKQPNFIKNLIREYLLDNQHRVRVTLAPDNQISARKEKAERARLDKIRENLSEAEVQAIVEQAQALKRRQEQEDDSSILPKVGLSDVPEKERSIAGVESNIQGTTVTKYYTGTNGLCYEQLIYPLPNFDSQTLSNLSLYNSIISELGAGNASYLEMQKRQHAVCGGINAFSSIRGGVNDQNAISSHYIYSGKALSRNLESMNELFSDIVTDARFDEHSRMQEIVSQIRISMEQSVTGNGHALAMTAAAANLSVPGKINHVFGGLQAIQHIKQLDQLVKSPSELESFADKLANIHESITKQQAQILLIGEKVQIEDTLAIPSGLMKTTATDSRFNPSEIQPLGKVHQAWVCNSQVNFCAQAFPSVPMGHEDAAALVILANYLRNNFLHRAVREQGGAYGGGASQDSNAGVFRFYSYRDPRMEETLSDFRGSIDWLLNQKADAEKLEEAILGTIGSIDRSESPAGQAKRCFHAELHGRTPEIRDQFRHRVLTTSHDDMLRVTETYLKSDLANTAVVTGKSGIEEAKKIGLDIIDL